MNDSDESWEIERIRRDASHWIERLKLPTPQDTEGFHFWLRSDARHGWAYLELVALDEQLRRCSGSMLADIDAVLSAASAAVVPIRTRLSAEAARGRAIAAAIPSVRFHRQASARLVDAHIAMTALFVCILVCFVLLSLSRHPTYMTRLGEYRVVRLPDGSQMHLNGSTMVIQKFGRATRRVELTGGEAFFDVTHDDHRPFSVSAGTIVVQALGTQFDVKMTGDDISVGVKRGQVAVRSAVDPTQPAKLIAASELGRIELSSSNIAVRRLAGDEQQSFFTWTGMLALRGMTVQEVVDRFNASNTMQIEIDDPSISLVRVGGSFSILEPEEFAAALRGLGIEASQSAETPSVIHLARRPIGAFGD